MLATGDKQQQPIMLALPQPVLQEMLNVIANAPGGCGMSAAANHAFRASVLEKAELVGPEQPEEKPVELAMVDDPETVLPAPPEDE